MFFSAQNYKAQIPQQKHDRCHDNRPQRYENSHLGGQYHVLGKACVNCTLLAGKGRAADAAAPYPLLAKDRRRFGAALGFDGGNYRR